MAERSVDMVIEGGMVVSPDSTMAASIAVDGVAIGSTPIAENEPVRHRRSTPASRQPATTLRVPSTLMSQISRDWAGEGARVETLAPA